MVAKKKIYIRLTLQTVRELYKKKSEVKIKNGERKKEMKKRQGR